MLHHLIRSGIVKSGFRSRCLVLVAMVRATQARVDNGGHDLVLVGMVW